MSSTDDDLDRRVAALFDELMVPLGAELRRRGVPLADVGRPSDATTWYVPVRPLTARDFELPLDGSAEALRAALLERWRDVPALQALAHRLADLAATAAPGAEQDSEVSPLVYVMY